MSAAENSYVAAILEAQRQAALFWELRATVSLSRLRVRQARHDEAQLLLAPVYNRFTEGFETADLRAASSMLDLRPYPGARAKIKPKPPR